MVEIDRLGKRITVLLVGAASCLLGCTTTYAVPEPAVPQERTIRYSQPPGFAAQLSRGQDTVGLLLRAAPCERTYAVDSVAPTHVYKKKTFLAGPGMVLGGLAAGGLGAGLLVAAKDQPQSCASSDDNCTSRDDMRGLGVVASGLGAAALVIGTYNAFKKPVLVGDGPPVVNRGQPQTDDCTLETQDVPVVLQGGGRLLAEARTDEQGAAAWVVTDRTLADWPAKISVFANGTPVSTVDVSGAVEQAQLRVLSEVVRQLSAEIELYQRDHPERVAPPPPPPPRQSGSSPSPAEEGTFSIFVFELRKMAFEMMNSHEDECRDAVKEVSTVVATMVLPEEEIAAYALSKLFGREMSKEVAEGVMWGLKRFFPNVFKKVTALLDQLNSGVATEVCEQLTNLINPQTSY